eukprot:scaffold2254_cov393-Prasinococcus_capsulatus_cf.AAC.8
MLQCVYYIRRIGGRDYVLGSDAAAVAATEHADENIQALSRTLSTAGDIISNQLGWIERCYIFGGVPAQATNSLLDCTSQLDGIDGYGVQKMHRNCSALQHTFAPLINSPILSFSGDTVQHLRRVEQFFDLLLLPVDALLGMVEEQPHNYSAKQYSQLLRIEVPNRQVGLGACHAARHCLTRLGPSRLHSVDVPATRWLYSTHLYSMYDMLPEPPAAARTRVRSMTKHARCGGRRRMMGGSIEWTPPLPRVQI